MTTQTSAPAAAARESARRADGKFGHQARPEAQLELFSAPVDTQRAPLTKAASSFGAQLSENSWEFLPGEQLKAAFPSPAVTGKWTTHPGAAGGRLDVLCAEESELHHTSYAAPNAAAAVSNLTADLDRRAGLHVPYRRDDLILDDHPVEVAFGVSPLAYSQTVSSNYQRDLAAGAYRQAHAEQLAKTRPGLRMTPAGLDDAARGCYTDALSVVQTDTVAAEALADPEHPEHSQVSAQTWGRCAAAAHFLTRGKGDSSKMADTLYGSVLHDHDADQAWAEVVGYHGEHIAPAFNNAGGCTNRPGDGPRKPSLLQRMLSR